MSRTLDAATKKMHVDDILKNTPDYYKIPCGEWSKHAFYFQYGSEEHDFIEVHVFREEDGTHTLMVSDGDEVIASRKITIMPDESQRPEARFEIGEIYWFHNDYAVGPNMQSPGTLVGWTEEGNAIMYNKRYGKILVTGKNLEEFNPAN